MYIHIHAYIDAHTTNVERINAYVYNAYILIKMYIYTYVEYTSTYKIYANIYIYTYGPESRHPGVHVVLRWGPDVRLPPSRRFPN